MQRTLNKLLALFLAAMMAASLFVPALADEEDDWDDWDDIPATVFVDEEPIGQLEPEISFARRSMTVDQGDDFAIYYSLTDAYEGDVRFTSSNSNVVLMDNSGYGVALSEGKATVTATVVGTKASATCEVTVKAAKAPEPSIELERGSIDTVVGTSHRLRYSVENAPASSVEWTSSNSSVASVDSGGNVTCLREGSATITARISGTNVSESCVFHIEPAESPAVSVFMDAQMLLTEGESGTLTAETSGGTRPFTYEWSTSNSSVVSISPSGSSVTVKAVSAGRATVTVEVLDGYGKFDRAVCTVVVDAKARPTVTTYDGTGSATVGSSMPMNNIANGVAHQFQRDFGAALSYSASVRFSTTNNQYGSIRYGNTGDIVSGSSTYLMFQDMIFEPKAAGTFRTTYSISDAGLTIGGSIDISVSGGSASIKSISISKTKLNLSTYSSAQLSLSISPYAVAAQTIEWSVDDSKIASVNGSGLTVTVQSKGREGKTNLEVHVVDGNGKHFYEYCSISVSDTAEFDPTITVTAGSDYHGTTMYEAIRTRFKKEFGVIPPDSASIRFITTGNNNRLAEMFLYNGTAIRAGRNYSMSEFEDMYLEAYKSGNFYIPYEISYKNDTMSGNLDITIRDSRISATISRSALTLSTYSNAALSITVTPKNASYRVKWESSDTRVAYVSGSGTDVRVESEGRGGTATITATITDSAGVSTVKKCTVTVESGAVFNPSVSTTVGVNYVGTGTSDAMISQFRSLYGMNLNLDKTVIRFSSTGNNNVGVMRLKDGTAIRANKDYTLREYVAMYTEPLGAGTFSVPYTLSYSGKSLEGNVLVNINASNIAAAINLGSLNPYTFSSATADGSTGSAILISAINNAIGRNWSSVRFYGTESRFGTLYQNSRQAALGSGNYSADALANLYFVPSEYGTYSISFTVYSSAGGNLASGTLSITTKGSAASGKFSDVSAGDYFYSAVQWAVDNGVTTGTTPTTFAPGTTCTRGQVATFIWRAAGSPEPASKTNPFRDVSASSPFYKAILWANEVGITTGYADGTFRPNEKCSYGHVLTFLWRGRGNPESMGYSSIANMYSGRFFTDAVAWADTTEILGGTSAFTPDDPCPRRDIVTYLFRAYGNYFR